MGLSKHALLGWGLLNYELIPFNQGLTGTPYLLSKPYGFAPARGCLEREPCHALCNEYLIATVKRAFCYYFCLCTQQWNRKRRRSLLLPLPPGAIICNTLTVLQARFNAAVQTDPLVTEPLRPFFVLMGRKGGSYHEPHRLVDIGRAFIYVIS